MINKFFFENDGIKLITTPQKMFILDDSFQGEGRMNREDNLIASIEDELDFIKFSLAYLTDEENVVQEFRAITLMTMKIRKKYC